jgi:DNA-binding NarL/FixJ family response regulator
VAQHGTLPPAVQGFWTQAEASSHPAPRAAVRPVAVAEAIHDDPPEGRMVEVRTRIRVTRVLVVDDQTLFRSGLRRLLEEDPRVEVVGEAVDGADAVKQVAALEPDVVLMDLKMPNLDGVEATKQITADHPGIKILILTTFEADSYVLQALRSGASGYVLKSSQPEAIVSSILAVMSGERVMASAIATRVLDMLTGSTTPKEFYDGLTAREIEILKLLATGQANKQIARRLNISEKTVRNHVSHLYEKLQIFDRSQAVLYAVRKGLVEL